MDILVGIRGSGGAQILRPTLYDVKETSVVYTHGIEAYTCATKSPASEKYTWIPDLQGTTSQRHGKSNVLVCEVNPNART
jgi:hypothetical protein